MLDLIGKIVEISTIETIYTGKLVEINENEAYLEMDSGWVVIPVERILSISEKDRE